MDKKLTEKEIDNELHACIVFFKYLQKNYFMKSYGKELANRLINGYSISMYAEANMIKRMRVCVDINHYSIVKVRLVVSLKYVCLKRKHAAKNSSTSFFLLCWPAWSKRLHYTHNEYFLCCFCTLLLLYHRSQRELSSKCTASALNSSKTTWSVSELRTPPSRPISCTACSPTKTPTKTETKQTTLCKRHYK